MSEVVAGIDLGGTSIKIAIADRLGHILDSESIPTYAHRGPDDVLARMSDQVETMLARLNDTSLAGLGVGVPGLVDTQSGVIGFLPNLPTQWRGVPARERLSQRLGCPVRLLNDVRTATLGELTCGHGKHAPHLTLVFFSIGTGIGGGVAIDGKLRLGPLGAAGELGHQTILAEGPLCGCGNRGCLETLASGSALVAEGIRLMTCGMAPRLQKYVDGDANRVTPKVMAAVANEDATVHDAIIRSANYLGIAAANVVNVLHPDLIVLGGGVAEIGELLIDTVAKVVRQRVGMFPTDGVRIEKSLLGEQAGVYGAVALALKAKETDQFV